MENIEHPTSNTEHRSEDGSRIALSIRQPWAWMILHAGKDIENREWKTTFRGKILIHTGKGMTLYEYENGQDVLRLINPAVELPMKHQLERGGIVGEVEIVDCVDNSDQQSDSQWFFGKYGLVLRNAKALPFTPCKGHLGFFKVNF